MRIVKARIQNYRSIIDTGEFEIDELKTILVGPNEAGKTAILQALQQINPPADVKKFNALRDYPRAHYTKISREEIDPDHIPVATAIFSLEAEDLELIPERLKGKELHYEFKRYLNNSATHQIIGADFPRYSAIKNDLIRLVAHMDRDHAGSDPSPHLASLQELTSKWKDTTHIHGHGAEIKAWLEKNLPHVDEDNEKETARWDRLLNEAEYAIGYNELLRRLEKNKPVFVLYSNYFRVKPLIHLGHLADRIDTDILDDDAYDYGNVCLLKLLGFTARQLSDLGKATAGSHSSAEVEKYRDQLDSRQYQLNSASVDLTQQIVRVWNPDEKKGEASKLKIVADGQYLKVVVEDDIGVEVELDQRSEGFQWLVSFFVVFFAEAQEKHNNTILLLDEPGVSLHALKQREFRNTISLLAQKNQTIYSTHSPFMVGPDELDIVRVVEMPDRKIGTKVHSTITSSDPAALLPLQEALGYDLAQSLFSQQRNLILEGLTDYWYLESISNLLEEEDHAHLNKKVALIPANTASKVTYFATILSAHKLKVAALLDSDNAGDQAAKQETLVHQLGNKKILRTADFVTPNVPKAEIEDILRHTLTKVAKEDLGWDIENEEQAQPQRPIVDIFQKVIGSDFSKYKLAKAFLRWSRQNSAGDLQAGEVSNCVALITAINSALK
ncbi:AAA family ATPase [Pseudomonas sp.]|uniref:AAA family ATPase n=1 Tax=Pseudomonas sp. TaxID=306 RepID=UPI003242E084